MADDALYRLRIDSGRCCRCGNCELYAPDVIGRPVGIRAEWLLTTDELVQHDGQITAAIEHCHLDAIILEIAT